MLEWWEKIDREEVLKAVRATIPNGGCVVLLGPESSGHRQAADLIEDLVREHRYTCFRSSRRSRPSGARAVLLGLWEDMEPPPSVGVIPPWITGAAYLSLPDVVEMVIRVARAVQPAALVLEDVDRDLPLGGYEMS